jgi:adenosylcobinamide-phosphate synthase
MIIAEDLLIALIGGIFIDFIFGDPPNIYHPVAWLGRVIGFFLPKLKSNDTPARREKINGVIFSISLISIFGIAIHIGTLTVFHIFGPFYFIILCSVILKISIAIKGMEKHAKAIMTALARNDLSAAQQNLALIVRRDTKYLDEQHVLSATIECIGESLVDGINSSLFYFSFLGPAGAFAFRIVNTLDSMLGYRDDYYHNIGWMSATIDTVANYVPARLTALLMLFAVKLVGADLRTSMEILRRDHDKTYSPNAGYPMATLAGALRIRLEKIGSYSLGEQYELLSIYKCTMAISIMKLTAVLCCVIFSAPLIAVLDFVGWWRLLFGV